MLCCFLKVTSSVSPFPQNMARLYEDSVLFTLTTGYWAGKSYQKSKIVRKYLSLRWIPVFLCKVIICIGVVIYKNTPKVALWIRYRVMQCFAPSKLLFFLLSSLFLIIIAQITILFNKVIGLHFGSWNNTQFNSFHIILIL